MITRLGKYEIRRELGRGAMGVVYEGYDPLIERVVALKTIRADQLVGEDAADIIARFRREAQAAGRLTHPNIVSIYDFGEDARRLVHRDGVRQGPRAQGVLRGQRALHDGRRRAHPDADPGGARLFAQAGRHPPRHQAGQHHPAADGIGEGRRFRHRAHRVVGTDAGRRRARHAELHVAGADPGPAGRRPLRLFSVGVILYQFLTGERPFTGSSTITMRKVLEEDPLPPSRFNVQIPGAMDAVVRKALAKRADDRLPDGRRVRRGAAGGSGEPAPPARAIRR